MRLSAGRSTFAIITPFGCQDWQLPFQIAGTDSASGNSFQSMPEFGSFTPLLMNKPVDTALGTCDRLLRVPHRAEAHEEKENRQCFSHSPPHNHTTLRALSLEP